MSEKRPPTLHVSPNRLTMAFFLILVAALSFVGVPVAVGSAYERFAERNGSLAGYLFLSFDSLIIGIVTYGIFRMFFSRDIATLSDRGVASRYFFMRSEAAWDGVVKVTPIGGWISPQAVMFVLKKPEQRPWWGRNVIVLAGIMSNRSMSDILDYVAKVRPELVTDSIVLNNFPWWKKQRI